jgi:phosphoglycolate phosphatase
MQEEIFASSFAAAAYLESIDFPKDKKVKCIFVSQQRTIFM